MFSFGTIKHNTCFYGAVSIVREQANIGGGPGAKDLCKKMLAIQETYPVYDRQLYRKKIYQCMVIQRVITGRWIVAASLRYFKWRQLDLEDYLISKIRGFAVEPENFLTKFRIQPCAPLLKMIYEKTKNYDKTAHDKKIRNFRAMAKIMKDAGYYYPGMAAGEDRSYWLFPFPSQNKQQFRHFCIQNGVFCYNGATQITTVKVPERLKNVPGYEGTRSVKWLIDNVVYFPVTSIINKGDFERLAVRQLDIIHRYNMYIKHVERIVSQKQTPKPADLPRGKL